MQSRWNSSTKFSSCCLHETRDKKKTNLLLRLSPFLCLLSLNWNALIPGTCFRCKSRTRIFKRIIFSFNCIFEITCTKRQNQLMCWPSQLKNEIMKSFSSSLVCVCVSAVDIKINLLTESKIDDRMVFVFKIYLKVATHQNPKLITVWRIVNARTKAENSLERRNCFRNL